MESSISMVIYGKQVINEVPYQLPGDKKAVTFVKSPEEERVLQQTQAVVQAALPLGPWDLAENMVPVVAKYAILAGVIDIHLHNGGREE